MATCRDWLADLLPASFRGVPFEVEEDREVGGRRVVVHEFPMRDEPFLEDMGEAARSYEVDAYIHGDRTDAAYLALVATCTRPDPGMLVLPLIGPRHVRCLSVEPRREGDRHGYVGVRLSFMREGAALGLATVGSAASLVYGTAAALLEPSRRAFTRQADIAGRPERVADATVARLRDAAAGIEAVRLMETVDPAVSAKVRDAVTSLDADAPVLLSRGYGAAPDTVDRLFAATSSLAEGMEQRAAVRAMADLAAVPVEPSGLARTPTTRVTLDAVSAVAQAARLAALAAYAESVCRMSYASRPDGVSARADVAEIFAAEMSLCIGAATADLYVALANLRGVTCDYLTRLITDLAPVAIVEAPRSMPSLWWAWRLYGDPARAAEIVARNGVPHPSFIPARFEALIS
jgi:prophage DNA circulation protein